MENRMFSVAILVVVLGYTWLLAPIAPRWTVAIPVVVVVVLAMWRAIRTGEWGVARSEFFRALAWTLPLTGAAAVALYAAGSRLGTWHKRADVWSTLAALVPWALGQQFVL